MTQLLRGEAAKLTSTRLWLWLLLASMALSALFASLNIAFNDDPDTTAPPVSTEPGQQLLLATAGVPAQTLVAVLAAVAVTGELRHRTATATFLATPRRGRVVLAKLLVCAAVGAGYALACLGVVVAVGAPWLDALGTPLVLTGDAVTATLAGVVASAAAFAALGVGVGALVRDQVATVVGLLVYLFVVEPVLTRIPALSEVTRYLPGPAASALTGTTLSDQVFLGPLEGGLVLLGYVAVAAAAGTYVTTRRDVT